MKFSFIIPTYNRADYLPETINSLLRQEYSDFEIIVVDDGSTDNTEEVVGKINDNRISYYKKTNGERGAARNYGAARASGQYINFFDSDDLAYPNHLSTAKKFISDNNNPPIFHLGYDFKTPKGELVSKFNNLKGNVNIELIKTNFLSCNGVFLRNDVCKEFPFEENRLLAVAEDWALWLKIGSRFDILFSNIITSSVVCHDQRSIKDLNIDKVYQRDILLIEKLLEDEYFVSKYKSKIGRFIADRYTYFALLHSLSKNRMDVIKNLYKAFCNDYSVVFRRRFIASLKHMVL